MIATHHIVGPLEIERLWECKFWRLLNLQISLHRRLNIVRWTLKSVNLITPLSFRRTSECVHINTYVHPSHTANKMCTATLIFQAKMAGRLCAHSFVFSTNKRGIHFSLSKDCVNIKSKCRFCRNSSTATSKSASHGSKNVSAGRMMSQRCLVLS